MLSASKSIAHELNAENLLNLFAGSMVLFGFILRILNFKILIKYKHINKMIWATVAYVFGILLIMFGIYIKVFWIIICGTTILGIGTGLGGITL